MSVVIAALPRSGSWLLAEALWRTGVVGRPEEYLRPDWLERFQAQGALTFQHRLHRRDPWPHAAPVCRGGETPGITAFLDEVQRIGTTPNGVFGLKCHWFQLEDLWSQCGAAGAQAGSQRLAPDWLASLLPGIRYVRLIRHDKLRQAISWHRAMTSNRWWSDVAGATPVRDCWYDGSRIDRLEHDLQHLESCWDGFFAGLPEPPLVVAYEDLATGYKAAISRVLDGLGVVAADMQVPPPRLRKQADAFSEAWVVRHRRGARAARPGVAVASGAPGHRPALDRRPAPQSEVQPVPKGESKMRTSILIVENFYCNPSAVREYALKQPYYYPYQSRADVDMGRRRATWLTSEFRSAADCPFKSSLELIGRLEEITGDCVDLDHWNLDFPVDPEGRPQASRRWLTSCVWNCSFHFKPDTGQKLGEGVHNHVVDTWNSVGEDGWAGILFLSGEAPLRGGLKLWRNLEPTRNYDWMTPQKDWELVDDLGNVPNRLLLCRGNLPHSGAGGWGTSPADGRLYQTFFFRVRPRQSVDGMLAPV